MTETELRQRAAIEAMGRMIMVIDKFPIDQVNLVCNEEGINGVTELVASRAVSYADALVAELRKEK